MDLLKTVICIFTKKHQIKFQKYSKHQNFSSSFKTFFFSSSFKNFPTSVSAFPPFSLSNMFASYTFNLQTLEKMELEKKIRWINLMLADHRLRNRAIRIKRKLVGNFPILAATMCDFSLCTLLMFFFIYFTSISFKAFQCTFRNRVVGGDVWSVREMESERARSWDVIFNYLQLLEFCFALVICGFEVCNDGDDCKEISQAPSRSINPERVLLLLID